MSNIYYIYCYLKMKNKYSGKDSKFIVVIVRVQIQKRVAEKKSRKILYSLPS